MEGQRRDRRYFFVHVMKTGGASLNAQLRREFGAAVYPDPEIDGDTTWSYSTPAVLVEGWPERRNQVELVTGHFPPCVVDMLDDDFTTLTLLRDPVERTLSFLRQRATTDEHFAGWSLEEVYDDPAIRRHRLVNNHVVSMFSVEPADMHFGLATYALWRGGVIGDDDLTIPAECDRHDLARAEQRLKAIDVVGVQERFDDFVAALSARFGWDLGPAVRSNRTNPVPVSEAFRARIARDNALDSELYALACELATSSGSR